MSRIIIAYQADGSRQQQYRYEIYSMMIHKPSLQRLQPANGIYILASQSAFKGDKAPLVVSAVFGIDEYRMNQVPFQPVNYPPLVGGCEPAFSHSPLRSHATLQCAPQRPDPACYKKIDLRVKNERIDVPNTLNHGPTHRGPQPG